MFAACSNDDDAIETTLTVKDFETTIEENPTEGKELGTIEADVNQGTLVYSLISENSKGSLAIDDKGNLTVKDASLYDYETLQKITATVQVKSGEIIKEISVNVLITNVDECIVFKDANFKKALLDHVDLVIDTNKDGEICETEARVVKKLQLDDKEISDLYGLEFFTALTELDCSGNNFVTLDLSKNTALTRLGLSANNNKLISLDLSKNVMLVQLGLSGGDNLTVLDLSENIKLTKLSIGGTVNLTTLDLSNNIMLTELSFTASGLTALDLSKNTALTSLFLLSNDAIASLDLSKNIALASLAFLGNDGILSLDLSKNTALTSISVWNANNISSLNLKNGNNAMLERVNFLNNRFLNCIEVDDPEAEYLENWGNLRISYASDCSL
jgi:hypothetical protein